MRRMWTRAAALGLLWTGGAAAQSLKPDEIYSTIAVEPLTQPHPVLGADGRMHLAYELKVLNPGDGFVRLDKIEAVRPDGGVMTMLKSDALSHMLLLHSGLDRTVAPGGMAILFMDVAYDGATPKEIAARVTAFRQNAGNDGKPEPLPADSPLPAEFSFTTAPVQVGRPAVILQPPLRGGGWVDLNGCCDTVNGHRGSVMSVNGRMLIGQRFAIDWMKLDSSGRVFTGEHPKVEDFPGYGQPVYAAGSGVVANLYDEADNQVPFAPVKGVTPASIGGNMVVIDMGEGEFAFYAHMQRGSLKVKLGDHVNVGQVIGLLGNSGNTSAPHLHFQVMDGPSPLNANGLPYVFTRFTGVGFLAGGVEAIEGKQPVKIDTRLNGDHINQLPLDNEVIDFP